MTTKFFKPAAITALCVVLLGYFFFGSQFFSYIRTGSRIVQDTVQDNVSIEFELERARDLADDIVPKIQANVRMIAEDEVEIAALEDDIAASQERLAADRESLARLRSTLVTQQVSYRIGGQELSRQTFTERLAQQFTRFQEDEQILASKQELLRVRQESLQAALRMHERAKHQKLQLEQRIEALAAKHRLIEATSPSAVGSAAGIDVSHTENLLADLQKRLDISERVLAHQADFNGQHSGSDEPIDEATVLAEFDQYFDVQPSAEQIAKAK